MFISVLLIIWCVKDEIQKEDKALASILIIMLCDFLRNVLFVVAMLVMSFHI